MATRTSSRSTNKSTSVFARLAIGAVLFATAACANAGGFLKDPPKWVAELRSNDALCTSAADEAKAKALAMGISPSRMSWLYGRKPFREVGHVSLVIDGWMVVDNGGLGRNVWGDAICPGNVCTVKEARRGYDESFMESATLAVRTEVALGEWSGLVASRD